jgi:hypothetical protein
MPSEALPNFGMQVIHSYPPGDPLDLATADTPLSAGETLPKSSRW